jgi:mono/diheme cytochrome c family protein
MSLPRARGQADRPPANEEITGTMTTVYARSWARIAGACLLTLATAAAESRSASLAKGKEAFEQCAVCHSATTAQRKMGPSLMGLYKREKLLNGQKVNDESVLGMVNKGRSSMPSFADVLSAEEKANLLVYLKSL